MTETRPLGVFVGLTTLDIISRVERYPLPNEKVTATSQTTAAGGPAANAAVTFSGLSGEAVLVTCLGKGAMAEIASKDLEAYGVRVIDCAPADYSLAVSSITVTEKTGDRSVVSLDAGGSKVAPELHEHRATIELLLERADSLLVDGHHPTLATEVLNLNAGTAKRTPIVLDAGRWKPQFEELTPLADYVVASADFQDPYGWVPTESTSASNLNNVVIRTHGENPIMWWYNDSSGEVAVEAVQPVDTLGAGDVFHGAFAFALSQSARNGQHVHGGRIEDMLEFSSRIAALKIVQRGSRSWLVNIEDALSATPR